jgi:uncharacterized protein (UPF0303 family)
MNSFPLLSASPTQDLTDPAVVAADLVVLARQEAELLLASFDPDVAWTLGMRIRELAASHGQAVAIDVHGITGQLFFSAMCGTTPSNIDWIRRKRNVVRLFERSSYAVGRDLAATGATLQSQQGLPERDYTPHGGCVPIRVRGAGMVGDVTVSGLPQRSDHNLAIEALLTFRG